MKSGGGVRPTSTLRLVSRAERERSEQRAFWRCVVWAPRGGQRTMRSMSGASIPERTAAARSGQAELFAAHRRRACAGRAVDEVVAAQILHHAEVFDWALHERPGSAEVKAIVSRLRDKALGRMPHSRCVLGLIESLVQCRRAQGLNDALIAFAAKPGPDGDEKPAEVDAARALALKDSGIKISSAVVSRSTRAVMTASVTEAQRGFAPRPDITNTLWKLDAAMRSFFAESVGEPLPTLLPGWMSVGLVATQAPREAQLTQSRAWGPIQRRLT